MDSSHLQNASFPPLSKSPPRSSILGNPSDPSNRTCWKDLLLSQNTKSQTLPLSYIPSEAPEVSFSEEEIAEEQKERSLSLIGYAIGKRPYYGSLLAAIKRKWQFKGSLELLSLEGDFFLFKFTCEEDYYQVWNYGPCFLNGRPFVFQKWDWNFRPSKEQITDLPLWIKLPNFPLCCWNEAGFSKVASRIGVPLAVDSLTAAKSRITFARLCVQITASSSLPDSIPINLNGMKFNQEILYDWKPVACTKCNTFSHEVNTCPLNPSSKVPNRGRSRSRANPRDTPAPLLAKKNFTNRDSPPREFSPTSHIGAESSQEVPEEEPTQNIPPSTVITDLNQPPILSLQLEDIPETEDDQSIQLVSTSKNRDMSTQAELNSNSSSVGVVTRSAAISPNRSTRVKSYEKIPKTPAKTTLEEENSKLSHNPSPSNQKINKKKGKRPSSSSSQ